MAQTCPHCLTLADQVDELEETVRQLREALLGEAAAFPVAWPLTRTEATIMRLLLRHPLVTRDLFVRAMEQRDPTWEADVKIFDVFVCKMRRKLRPFGVEILTRWGEGYFLDPAARKAIAEAATAGEARVGDPVETRPKAGPLTGPVLSALIASRRGLTYRELATRFPGRAGLGAVLGRMAELHLIRRESAASGRASDGRWVYIAAGEDKARRRA